MRFLEAMHAVILSHHRCIAPLGLNGGESGKIGRNRVERHTGRIEALGAPVCSLKPGDAVVIDTPGGGGYGEVSL